MAQRKICIECGEDKQLTLFPRNYDNPTGRSPLCKACTAAHEDEPVVTKRQAEWGITVPQDPQYIWQAMCEAFGNMRFDSLRMKRTGAFSRAGQW